MENTKEKNLLDLEYNAKLNIFNVFLVLIGTAVISIILSSLDLGLKKVSLGFLFVTVILGTGYYHLTLNRIKQEIRNL